MQIAQAKTSSRVTHYIARWGRRIVADEPKVARDEAHCLRLAVQASTSRAGVIAFSREGDLDTGAFDDPVILVTRGEVPELI